MLPDHHAIVMGPLALRPSVLRFARAMEARLRDNDHKGGWQHETPRWLIERLRDEVRELDDAVNAIRRIGPEDGLVDAVWREAADVGNFAMMAAEVATDAVYPDRSGQRCGSWRPRERDSGPDRPADAGQTIAPDLIDDNLWQPRKTLDPEALESLAGSIGMSELLQFPLGRRRPDERV